MACMKPCTILTADCIAPAVSMLTRDVCSQLHPHPHASGNIDGLLCAAPGRNGYDNSNGSGPQRRPSQAYTNGAAPPSSNRPPTYPRPPREDRSDANAPDAMERPPPRPSTFSADGEESAPQGSSSNVLQPPARAGSEEDASTSGSADIAPPAAPAPVPVLAAAPRRPSPRQVAPAPKSAPHHPTSRDKKAPVVMPDIILWR